LVGVRAWRLHQARLEQRRLMAEQQRIVQEFKRQFLQRPHSASTRAATQP
jgi:hypothetical protein